MNIRLILASIMMLISQTAFGKLNESKVSEYLDHSDHLLINLLTDYRKIHPGTEASARSSKEDVDDAFYYNLLKNILNKQQVEALYPSESKGENKSRDRNKIKDRSKSKKSKAAISDETEKNIILTVSNFSNYIKSAHELYPIYLPTDDEKSKKDGIKIYKKRLASEAKTSLKSVQDNCNNGLSFTVIKPAVIEMFYNASKEKFFDVFTGTMTSPLRSLVSGYVFAKDSGDADYLKSFFLHSGFQVEKCSLLKMERFQYWLMHAEAGSLHSHNMESETEEEFSFDLNNKNIKTQKDFVSHMLGYVYGKLEEKEKEELEKLAEKGQEGEKINFFFDKIKQAIVRHKIKFEDKNVLLMDKADLKYKYKGKATRPEFSKEHLIMEPSEVKRVIADTLGLE